MPSLLNLCSLKDFISQIIDAQTLSSLLGWKSPRLFLKSPRNVLS